MLTETNGSVHVASEKRSSSLETLLLLILGGFALSFLFETTRLEPTAALFPRFVAEASLFLFVIAFGFRFLGGGVTTVQGAGFIAEKKPQNAMSFSAALALQAGYITMVLLLGFPIATLMYLLACPRLMGYQRWKILVSYGVLLTGVVFVAFVYVLHVRFPEGLLWGSFKSSR
jgi:hypothetical protein